MSNKDTYKRKHAYLDKQINTLEKHNSYNRTVISNLKKKKLPLYAVSKLNNSAPVILIKIFDWAVAATNPATITPVNSDTNAGVFFTIKNITIAGTIISQGEI